MAIEERKPKNEGKLLSTPTEITLKLVWPVGEFWACRNGA